MFRLDLNAEQRTTLIEVLESYVSDLRMEIADTDNPGYRRELRAERELLESVVAKLDAGARASGLRDAEGRVVVRMVGVWELD